MSIFSPSDAPCGIFRALPGDGLTAAVSFVRSDALLHGHAPKMTSAGEVLLSWTGIGTVALDWQPQPSGYVRQKQGVLVQVDVQAFAIGVVDLQEGDRCYGPEGKQLECVTVNHWGLDHTYIELQQVGR